MEAFWDLSLWKSEARDQGRYLGNTPHIVWGRHLQDAQEPPWRELVVLESRQKAGPYYSSGLDAVFFLTHFPSLQSLTAVGSGIWGPRLWASWLLARSKLYVEDYLQSLLPGYLELVQLPFNPWPLFSQPWRWRQWLPWLLASGHCVCLCVVSQLCQALGLVLWGPFGSQLGWWLLFKAVFPLLPLSPSFHVLPII